MSNVPAPDGYVLVDHQYAQDPQHCCTNVYFILIFLIEQRCTSSDSTDWDLYARGRLVGIPPLPGWGLRGLVLVGIEVPHVGRPHNF